MRGVRKLNYRKLFKLSDAWFTLGIVTRQYLHLMAMEYERSGDRSSEHYRYGAFLNYLKAHRPLDPVMADALYELGNADPDYVMGGGMMHDIIGLPECPPEVLDKARHSDRKFLVK